MPPSVDAPAAPRSLNNYVGGSWERPSSDEVLVSRNPATGQELARVPLSASADVERAVAAARAAQPGWAATPILVRARAIMDLRQVLVAHQDELARIVATDMGKTVPDAFAELGRGIESVEAAIAAPHLLKGDVLEGVSRGIDVESFTSPWGWWPRSPRSTSPPWSRSGSSRSPSSAATRSSSSRRSRTR